MKDQSDEQLLPEMARRNWVIFTLLILASVPWRSWPVTLGVVGGGLVAIGGFLWLHRSLRQLLAGVEPGGARKFQFGYVTRLAALVAVLAVLLFAGVHPAGLAAGLSVVVINILWTTIKRVI